MDIFLDSLLSLNKKSPGSFFLLIVFYLLTVTWSNDLLCRSPRSLWPIVLLRSVNTCAGTGVTHSGLNVQVWLPTATRRSPSP